MLKYALQCSHEDRVPDNTFLRKQLCPDLVNHCVLKELRNCNHHLIPRQFHHSHRKPPTQRSSCHSQVPFPLSPHNHLKICMDFPIPDCPVDDIICSVPSSLASFTRQDAFKAHPYWNRYRTSASLACLFILSAVSVGLTVSVATCVAGLCQ